MNLPFYLYVMLWQDDNNIFRFHVVFIKHLFVSCNYISSWIWCKWQKIYMNLASNHHELAYLYTHSGHWFLIFPIPATLIFGNCTKWEKGNFFLKPRSPSFLFLLFSLSFIFFIPLLNISSGCSKYINWSQVWIDNNIMRS